MDWVQFLEAGKAPRVATANVGGKLNWAPCQNILIPNINLQTNCRVCKWSSIPFDSNQPFCGLTFKKPVHLPFKISAYSLESTEDLGTSYI